MRANMFLGMAGAVAAVAFVFAAFSAPASAATATANLGVTATVTNNCTISTAALAFGSYDPVVANASTNLDGSGTVSVACTKGTYVRTLCADMGERLGCGAHLAALRRIRSGQLDVADALPLRQLLEFTREQLVERIVPLLKLAAATSPAAP